ncbi:MAG: CAP domain-containing protein [Bacillota bacterium]
MNKAWPKWFFVMSLIFILAVSALADGTVRQEPLNLQNTASLKPVPPDEQYIFRQVNAERRKAGLRPLILDRRLVKTARAKSGDMITRRYFSHNSPALGTPFQQIRKAGIPFRTAGENIAGNRSAVSAMRNWMKSPGHRRNILNPRYKRIGIGVIRGGPFEKMMTQHFVG